MGTSERRLSAKLVETRAGPVCVEECGAGPTVVLLASGGHGRGDWDAVRHELAAHFRTIAVDWPGHGDSPDPDPGWRSSAEGFADVAEDVLEAVAGTGPVAIAGNSVGGFAAARLAIRDPGRVWALVLVDSGGFLPLGRKERAFNAAMSRPWFLRGVYPWFARWYVRPDTGFAQEVTRAAVRNARRTGTTQVLNGLWAGFSAPGFDLRAAAGQITAPTLAVWGRRDPILPPAVGRWVADAVPGARLELLDTGHVPFATRPREFLDAVMPFLREHAETG